MQPEVLDIDLSFFFSKPIIFPRISRKADFLLSPKLDSRAASSILSGGAAEDHFILVRGGNYRND